MSAPEIKLQKIGKSIRATIPKKIARAASLEEGDIVAVIVENDNVVLKKKNLRRKNQEIARFYGALKEKTGEVTDWLNAEEIKNIWE
jgi:AbrB family looped-hinge helix DNA binding protein